MAPGAERIAGLLLAGGASTRLGRDKARLVLPASRQTLAENARQILEAAGLPVIVAARDRERAEMLLPGCTAVDDGPGRGPAAALLGAHAAYPDCTFVALACDMPLVPPDLLRLLPEIAGDWVVPAWTPGTLTPLPPSPADGRGGRTLDSWRGFAPPAPQAENGEVAPNPPQAESGEDAPNPSLPRRREPKSGHTGQCFQTTDLDPGLAGTPCRGDELGALVFNEPSRPEGPAACGSEPGEGRGAAPPYIDSPPSPSAERGAGGRGPDPFEPEAWEPEGGTPSVIGSPPFPSAERGAGGRDPDPFGPEAGEPEGGTPSVIGSPPSPSAERGVGGRGPDPFEPKAGEPEGRTPSVIGSPPFPSAERGAGGRGPDPFEPEAGEPEGGTPSVIGSPPLPSAERRAGGRGPDPFQPKAGEPEGGTPSVIGSPPFPSAERGAGGRGPNLRLEPLCAMYRPKALAALARRVAAGRFDLRGLADEGDVVVARLGEGRIASFGDPAAIFRNINEPRDFDAFGALPPRGSADTIRG